MEINGFGKATIDEINKLEKETGFILPDDYREFLMLCNGGKPVEYENGFSIEGSDEILMLKLLFGVGNTIKESLNIEHWIKIYEDEIPKKFILPIGLPEGGGFILLIRQKKEGVYFWDDTLMLPKSNESNFMYKIANTFTEFIHKIEKKKY